MTKCYQRSFEFPRVNRRIVEARFDGGDITSDGGVLLLRQADRLTGLSDSIARALSDPRRQASCDHDVPGLVRQRLYAIALGYEDLNDHDGLRQDVALQTAVERDQWLASASTLTLSATELGTVTPFSNLADSRPGQVRRARYYSARFTPCNPLNG